MPDLAGSMDQQHHQITLRGQKRLKICVTQFDAQLYNHAGRHMSLKNRTPGDAAGIKIEGRNNMLTIIENMA